MQERIPHIEQDAEVWKAFKAGDDLAFKALMQKNYKNLYNYGLRIHPDAEFIKDCIQDVFLNLWQYRTHLTDVQSPKFYLIKSLRQKIFKELNKEKKLAMVDDLPEEYTFEVQFTIENEWIDQQATEENSQKIKKLLQQLTKRQREAIYLKFYQQLDYEQIAEMMSISPHSATNLIYDALKFLRKNWIILLLASFVIKI